MTHAYLSRARDQSIRLLDEMYYGNYHMRPVPGEGFNTNALTRFIRNLSDAGILARPQSEDDLGNAARRKWVGEVLTLMASVATTPGRGGTIPLGIEVDTDATLPSRPEIDASIPQRTFSIELPNNFWERYGNHDQSRTFHVRLTSNIRAGISSRFNHAMWVVQTSVMDVITDQTTIAGLDAQMSGTTSDDNGLVTETSPHNLGYTVRPSDELLATLRESVRPFAYITVPAAALNTSINSATYRIEDGSFSIVGGTTTIQQYAITKFGTGEALIARAKESYRAWMITRFRSRTADPAEQARAEAQAEHRRKAGEAFVRFRDRNKVTDHLIPTLPFVPHGLASSRRWGIEVESGGARGVTAPDSWTRKTDSSLRSAWDGYREVQDFEPYDEEVTDVLAWTECANFERHMPHEQYYNAERSEYLFRVREDFVAAEDCTECGARTRTVRREPQTIVHQAQRDDCAEFVSPILVSMHSNGLKALTDALALQPQNDTAGVHVHVEARDLDTNQLATLLVGYDMLEPFIDASYQRGRRTYCERRSSSSILELARKLKRGEEISMDLITREPRYLTTNTHSLNRHGTVEFRAMGPVYNYDYLVRWAMFCREMVNLAKAGVTIREFAKVRSWNDVTTLFAKYGKEFLRASVYEMTGETGHQAALTKSDQPVTTEAANLDLQVVFGDATLAATAAMRRLNLDITEATNRLVNVDRSLAQI